MSTLNDQQMKQALEELLKIIPSYQKHYFYNNSLVDPYLLASHGLQISKKRSASPDSTSKNAIDLAVCKNNNCDLSVQFDTSENLQEKEDLEELIHEHDSECSYLNVKQNLINFKLFSRLGKHIYQENLAKLIEKRVWIQLNPKQITKVVNVSVNKETSFNVILEQLKQLDANIKGQVLTKITSSIYLAIFGWQWTQKSIIFCRFCGSSRDVTEFISPLECSLLKVADGFSFMSSHHSWCCLMQSPQNYWQQILRQAVIGNLHSLEGQVSQSQAELQCKNIQRSMIQIYRDHIGKIGAIRRDLQESRQGIKQKYGKNKELYQMLDGHVQLLETALQQEKEIEESLIRNTCFKS